jgi:hypothetical protein
MIILYLQKVEELQVATQYNNAIIMSQFLYIILLWKSLFRAVGHLVTETFIFLKIFFE